MFLGYVVISFIDNNYRNKQMKTFLALSGIA